MGATTMVEPRVAAIFVWLGIITVACGSDGTKGGPAEGDTCATLSCAGSSAAAPNADAGSSPSSEGGGSGALDSANAGSRGEGEGEQGLAGAGGDGGSDGSWGTLTPLPELCEVLGVPPQWLNDEHTRLLGVCDAALASLAIDGTEAVTISKTSGGPAVYLGLSDPLDFKSTSQVTVMHVDSTRLVYLESTSLKTAVVTGGKVVTLANDVKSARVTPDGSRVVYVAAQAGSGNLALFSIAVSGEVAVLLSDALNLDARSYGIGATGGYRLSADGKLVWFVDKQDPSASVGSSAGVLSVIPVVGGVARPLTTGFDLEVDEPTVWARDGRKMAFLTNAISSTGTGLIVRVISVDPDTIVDLPLDGFNIFEGLSLSAAGDHVWFTYLKDNNYLLYSAPTEGGTVQELAKFEQLVVIGAVGEAGGQLLFGARNGAASPQLFEVALAGGEPKLLGTLSNCTYFDYLAKSISADRTQLPFVDAEGSLLLANLEDSSVTTVLLEASSLSSSERCSAETSISPDRSQIAFRSCPLANCGAAVVDLRGNVTLTDATNSGFSFSPDSRLFEHHSGVAGTVRSLSDKRLSYDFNDAGGNVRPVIWLDGRHVALPGPTSEQIVSFP